MVFNEMQLKSKYIILFHGFTSDTRGYLTVCALSVFFRASAGRDGEKIIRAVMKVAAWIMERFSTDCRKKKKINTIVILIRCIFSFLFICLQISV